MNTSTIISVLESYEEVPIYEIGTIKPIMVLKKPTKIFLEINSSDDLYTKVEVPDWVINIFKQI